MKGLNFIMKYLFKDYASNPDNPNWENIIQRKKPLPTSPDDIRSSLYCIQEIKA